MDYDGDVQRKLSQFNLSLPQLIDDQTKSISNTVHSIKEHIAELELK